MKFIIIQNYMFFCLKEMLMVMQKCSTNSGLTIHGNQVKAMAVRYLKYVNKLIISISAGYIHSYLVK